MPGLEIKKGCICAPFLFQGPAENNYFNTVADDTKIIRSNVRFNDLLLKFSITMLSTKRTRSPTFTLVVGAAIQKRLLLASNSI